MKRPVLMVGTSLDAMGGISAVVGVWQAEGLFAAEHVVYVSTHGDVGPWRKLWLAGWAFIRFLWLLVSLRPRLVHVHLASRASFWRKLPFMTAASLWCVPYLVHLHGAEFRQFYGQTSGPIARRLIRRTFDRAGMICVLSSTWRDWVLSVSPRSRVAVVYNAVPLPVAASAHKRDAGVVLFLGRLGVRKGVYDLLEAFVVVARHFPDSRLRLGGDGDLDAVRNRAADLGIADRVDVLGWVSGEAKSQELARADVYALPSYNEGLPMSVLEAMAAGLPVLTCPVGGIPDAVTDGVEGFLVPPGDVPALSSRLQALLADESLRQRMGDAARYRVRTQFSSSAAVERVGVLYEQLAPSAVETAAERDTSR
jgi:glycosyltransferase involved in cell wall biosynthesis